MDEDLPAIYQRLIDFVIKKVLGMTLKVMLR